MTTQTKKLKALSSKDSVSIVFGEWFDKTYGNTYYDTKLFINNDVFRLPYQYGYNHGDQQAVNEALKAVGYRLRKNTRDHWKPLRNINTTVIQKLKRDLIK